VSTDALDLDLEEIRQVAAFRLALRQFHAVSDAITRRCRLTPRQYLLLLALEAAGGPRGHLNVGQVVAALGLAQGTVTELLDRSEAAGLVRRRRPKGDRRVAQVRVTPEGHRRFTAAFRALGRERDALARLADRVRPRVEEASGRFETGESG
jgi:DNA-binding MarR family transcriptional regulator